MVNEPATPDDPERALALTYAPAEARRATAALLALDDRLAGLVRAGREPMIAQMRLTWWFEALERLDREPPPAEPVLRALAAEVLPRGITGAALAAMVDGWEAVLGDEPLTDEAIRLFAEARGGRLFDVMAAVCGAADAQARTAGEGWALANLATGLTDADEAARVRVLAGARLRDATGRRWSRAGRGLGALALLARFRLEEGSGVAKVGRLLWHRMTGR